MSEPSESRSTAERILDLAVFAPLGLVLSVGEVVPELARKGRDRIEPQVGTARALGQLAIGQGRQRLSGLVPAGRPFPLPASFKGGLPFGLNAKSFPFGPAASWASQAARNTVGFGARANTAPGVAEPPAATSDGRPARPSRERAPKPVVRRSPDIESSAGHVAGPRGPRAEELAITSYDTLSASQVVQRLAGLSPEEVRAVRAYEATTRGRRTVLAKADQLLA